MCDESPMRGFFWFLFFTSGLALTLTAIAFAVTSSTCPKADLGEAQEDCPWAELAREWAAIADRNASLTGKLRAQAPTIAKQLERDSRLDDWKTLWGKSINYDEYAKGTILHPEIYRELERVFGTSGSDGKIVHAGLEHTYGYLFSVLRTPFGYKRARWVRGEIEQGFGLPKGLLGPQPEDGTLFANLTYFAGQFAFPDAKPELNLLKKRGQAAAKAIRDFSYIKVKPIILEEAIELPSHKIVLRTDFVPFIKTSAGKNTHLLIYSVRDNQHAWLVTAFPVEVSFVEKATDSASLGKNQPIITRYNAYVDGITGTAQTGERRLIVP